nr:hypothetical protein [Moraxella osloensis]
MTLYYQYPDNTLITAIPVYWSWRFLGVNNGLTLSGLAIEA